MNTMFGGLPSLAGGGAEACAALDAAPGALVPGALVPGLAPDALALARALGFGGSPQPSAATTTSATAAPRT
ncbi:MAG: hypothetical protein HY908_31095 [Myxococcales bacterium]|nr:hypothetical protein [Myxococcales bacterium]